MKIRLAYGKEGLNIELNSDYNIDIIEPVFVPGVPDAVEEIENALLNPISAPALNKWIDPAKKVGIVFSDITRPAPNDIILPIILRELDKISAKNITLFLALGTHRENSESEIRAMIGDEIYDKYAIIQNDAFDKSRQINIGKSSLGHEIWLNREILDCDYQILTGFIEPHFFAGFSGGGKAIMPGMAGQETVLGNHDAGMIEHSGAVWGITRGNPIWEEIHEVASRLDNTFLLNVTLNKQKEITAVFAGELMAAHAAGCEFVKKSAMIAVDDSYDIVITSNSGYPLDLNLYQSVKGMSAAAQIVRQGGSIIIAAECWDGIPDHGLYGSLLHEAENPQILLDSILNASETRQDQWQAQIQAQIQLKADVYVYSDRLTDREIEKALLKPCSNIETTIDLLMNKYGPDAKICVLPEGPQTVPFIDEKLKED